MRAGCAGESTCVGGAPVAGMSNAPVLLTPASSLPASVVAELSRLAPSRIVILGGSSAVSPTSTRVDPTCLRDAAARVTVLELDRSTNGHAVGVGVDLPANSPLGGQRPSAR